MTPAQLTGTTDSHLQSTMVGQKAFLMHPDVANDLLNMIETATKAGFKMEIASGFRDFSRQRAIWNGKFEGELPILDSNSQPLNKAALSDEEKLKAILRWSLCQEEVAIIGDVISMCMLAIYFHQTPSCNWNLGNI
ncbi:hypothetical protein AJ90_12315 [Vibrio parahaemolyticus M0605]|nr:hypothetical protein AJ90_12315 [Vibrio parahaemolyticus M0605]